MSVDEHQSLDSVTAWNPLSFSQQRLWLFQQLQPSSLAYNVGGLLWFEGDGITLNTLQQALNDTVAVFPSIRTQFAEVDGKAAQRVLPVSATHYDLLDVREEANPVEYVQSDARRRWQQPFDLTEGKLARSCIYQVEDQKFAVLLATHHIVTDAWSLQIIIKTFVDLVAGKPYRSRVAQTYLEYASEQVSAEKVQYFAQQKTTWENHHFIGEDSVVLPSLNDQSQDAYTARHELFTISDELNELIKEAGSALGATKFEVLASAMMLTLRQYSSNTHPSICVPALNRNSKNRRTVGFYVNSAVMGYSIEAEDTLASLVAHTKSSMKATLGFEATPLELLTGDQALPTTAINFRNHGDKLAITSGHIKSEFEEFPVLETPFEIVLDVVNKGNAPLRFVYAKEKFTRPFISKFIESFKSNLLSIVDTPSSAVASVNAVSNADLRLIDQYGKSEHSWSYRPFTELVSQQASCSPDSIALKHQNEQLSYFELETRSNQLAHAILAKDASLTAPVGVMMERGVDMIVSMIAVLKAGAPFLPLDPDYPTERLSYMLEDSGAELLLTHNKSTDRCRDVVEGNTLVSPLCLDDIRFSELPADHRFRQPLAEELAYIIYTSGSTGKPKGVTISHQGLSMHVQTIGQRYGMTRNDVELHFASISFDGAVERWTVPLAFGSKLVIRDQELWTAEQTCYVLESEQVTVACFPPSYVGPLLDWVETEKPNLALRSITLGGEAFTRDTFERIQTVISPPRIINGYGPTETVITPMIWAAYPDDSMTSAYAPIGHAVGDRKLYVLDSDLNPVPLGCAGELYIGSEVSLAEGYLKRPDLTSERFLPDPFSSNGERMYRTGDLVKWREDGVMEYLGRVDQQVKIRGFRVELGEIESQLQSLSDAEFCAVVDHDSPTGKKLVGYVQLPEASGKEESSWISELSQTLPDYMVPSRILVQKKLPITPAGKVDRKQLLAPDWNEISEVDGELDTEQQRALGTLWCELLKLERVGSNNHFFALGGDSIMALQLVGKLRQIGYRLTPKQVFDYPKLEQMAEQLEEASFVAAEQAKLEGETKLLPIQSRFIERYELSCCNQYIQFEWALPVDTGCLSAALNKLSQQHDALRLRFSLQGHAIYSDDPCFEITEFDQEIDAEHVQHAIDLTNGVSVSVGLTSINESHSSEVLISIHHLIVDALSWPVIIEDLATLYEAELSGKSVALTSKTHHQGNWLDALKSVNITELQRTYWQKQTCAPLYPNKRGTPLASEWLLDNAELKQLVEAGFEFARLTQEQVVFVVSAMTISALNAQCSFTIHRESHGRFTEASGLDLSRTVGWYTSLYPQCIPEQIDLANWVKSIKDTFDADGVGGITYHAGVAQQLWPHAAELDVLFNYLGNSSQQFNESVKVNHAGLWRDNESKADAAVVFNVSAEAKHLKFAMELDQACSSELSVDALHLALESSVNQLLELFNHAIPTLTKSDTRLVEFTQSQLDDLCVNAAKQSSLPKTLLPLSTLQQGLHFHAKLSGSDSTYVNQITLPLTNVDVSKMKAAWQSVMNRHQMLRSTLFSFDGNAYLAEWAELELDSYVHDVRQRKHFDVPSLKEELVNQGFLLEQGLDKASVKPLWRVDFVQTSDDHVQCVFTIHHILMDGWSTGVLLSDLFALYHGRTLAAVKAEFSDYLAWVAKQDSELSNEYWQRYLQGTESPTRLAESYGRSAVAEPKFVRYNDDFTKEELSNWLTKLNQAGVTLNTLTQAAWLLTLHRFTGQNSPIFGNTVAGRPTDLAHSDSMVGLFINTLPITHNVDLSMSVSSWLQGIQRASSEQREFSFSSLSDIQQQTGWSGENLFDTLVVFENYPLDESLLNGDGELLVGEPESYEFTHYPLTLAILPSESLRIVFAFDESQFSTQQIESLSATNRHYLEQLVERLDSNLGQIPDLEITQLRTLESFHKEAETWSFKPFTELVSEQAKAQPSAEALASNIEQANGAQRLSVSYEQLDKQSDAVAAELVKLGIQREDIVGVLFERDCNMLITMMGVMKAGAAFLPLDPSYPKERLNYMMEDSGARVLIHDEISALLASDIANQATSVNYRSLDLSAKLSPLPLILPDQLAYMIYTSGSTGKPKGVCVSQSGLSMHVQTIGQRYGMTKEDVELHFASISFDGAIERWTVPLAFGSRLVIRDQQLWSAQQTCEVLEREQVTIACFPPSYVLPLLEWIEGAKPDLQVRSWTLGGEAFTRDTYFKLQSVLQPKRIINGYGPTETVVTPMIWEAYSDTTLDSAYAPIGTSVGSRTLYVLDAALNRVPLGVAGELYIGEEVGLARGYFERPGMTSERFLPDPFARNGERMYRTGDLVKWRADGVMEYLGRSDEQVKIRGFRVELGEIESRLLAITQSEQCAVIACESPSGKQLVAYVQSEEPISPEFVLAELASDLPDYMVPTQLLVLEKIPLTPASKVDKKRLPEPTWSADSEVEYVAPIGEIEIALATQWQSLFNKTEVGRHDDFFALGGQSLLATQLVGRLKQQDGIRLSLQAVFDTPELAQLATQCQKEANGALAIVVTPRLPFMPASAVQKRLWFVQQLLPNSAAYHMPLGLAFNGNVDLDTLQMAVNQLVANHEILRTNFTQVDGELMQSISDKREIKITRHSQVQGEREAYYESLIAQPFDFERGALIRFDWIQSGDDKAELLIVVHHIISDGVSIQLLLKELSNHYALATQGLAQTGVKSDLLQYADYVSWQQHWLESPESNQQKTWWLNALKHDIEPLVLHSDVPREQLETRGNRLHFELTSNQIQAVKQLAKSHQTTPFNVMLTLWHLLMHKYSGQDQVRVGVPVAGRTQSEMQSMQGCFINSVVIPANFDSEDSFSSLLNQVKSFSEQALERQDFPFEMLVESLGITGNLQYHPVFQTSFNLQSFDQENLLEWHGADVEPFDPGVVNAQLEIAMDIQQFSQDKWSGFISYVSPVFSEETAQSMLSHWLLLLAQATEDQSVLIGQIHLSDEHSMQQVKAFNATELDWGQFVAPPQAIELQAEKTPDAIALSMQGQSLTYKAFNDRVNQLANWLRGKGVNTETRVGLGLERSFDLVIALHAITRAGGAYVPLDPSYPAERLNYILESANIDWLLTDSNAMHLWPSSETCQYIDISALDLSEQSTTSPDVDWQAEQALYVIFTSGSTGLPKGVVNTQAALQNRLNWMQKEYNLNPSDCVLQKTPFSFDVSVWEFFWPLMTGARLAIAPPDSHRQPSALSEVIQKEKVTTIHFVPSMLNAFAAETKISDCTSLKRIVCSGEALPSDLAEQVLTESSVELHNLYGPTEAAIDVTYWPCELPVSKRIPIGYAISNTQLYVLDGSWNPVPNGVPGELYLAGVGLAREYLGRPDLTADRFIPNPWGEPGSRLYRTGDQVVQMEDGRYEYLGRLDNQVKIRGLRIELEEIENVINQLDWVVESAVIAFKHQTGDQLVGYIIDPEWGTEKGALVKAHLSEHLPDYMVPAIVIGLPEMPLSPNGKRDRKALPAPEWQSIEYREPETELEIWFSQNWAEVLEVKQVGLDDNFFALGGHSLLATRVVARAQQELGLEIALKDFFEAKTLQVLTDSLQTKYQTQNEQEQDEFDAMAALMDELELL